MDTSPRKETHTQEKQSLALSDARTQQLVCRCNEISSGYTPIDVEQNTNEWLLLRQGPLECRIGSSEIGVAAGLSRWKTAEQFLVDRVARESVESNAAMQHGHHFEPLAAKAYTLETGREVRDAGYMLPCALHNRYFDLPGDCVRFGCSLDRLGDEVDLEIKCPFSQRSFERYYATGIQLSHLAQLHLQMALRQRSQIHYVACLFDRNTEKLLKMRLSVVHFNEHFWRFIYCRARLVSSVIYEVLHRQLSLVVFSLQDHPLFDGKDGISYYEEHEELHVKVSLLMDKTYE